MKGAKTASGAWRFFSRTIYWAVALVAVPACAKVLGGPSIGVEWTVGEILFFATSWLGLLLPFAAFAGGLGCAGKFRGWPLGAAAFAISITSFLFIGFASPLLQFNTEAGVGVNVDERYPEGPVTITGLQRLRSRVQADPPVEYSFSTEELLQLPPNWITHRIHSVFVLSLFAILAAFLGGVTAGLTTGLSPPAGRNARWALGLASGVLFFIGESLGGKWVRADPLHSGVLGAWGAMLIPVLELAFLYLLLLLRGRRRSTLSSVSSSDV